VVGEVAVDRVRPTRFIAAAPPSQKRSSVLKKSSDAQFGALLDLESPDFAGESCSDLGSEPGSKLAAAAALPFFNTCP
jgi:hypothetical protein